MDGVYRFSRDNARTPMQWDSSPNAGFSTKKPWMSIHSDYKDVNVESEKKDPGSVLNWYIELSKLRDNHPVLINGTYIDLMPDDEKIFAFRRENIEARATVLINLSSETALYDAYLVERAVQIAGTEGTSTVGRLSPYEAVVFEESSVEYIVLNKDEEGILRDFIYEAIFVPEGEEAPDRSIIEKPEISMYYKDFGSMEADRCIVAKKGTRAVGAVWTRIMNDYGHLDDETPSLAVSLFKEYRDSGIGTVLMKKMLSLLKSQGFKKVSLSCQKANYAACWYKKLGFRVVVDKDDEYIMVYDL
jgi:ribosomal protein S18 acetylase RimI-like enzyme